MFLFISNFTYHLLKAGQGYARLPLIFARAIRIRYLTPRGPLQEQELARAPPRHKFGREGGWYLKILGSHALPSQAPGGDVHDNAASGIG